jgi:hypothetical protein
MHDAGAVVKIITDGFREVFDSQFLPSMLQFSCLLYVNLGEGCKFRLEFTQNTSGLPSIDPIE